MIQSFGFMLRRRESKYLLCTMLLIITKSRRLHNDPGGIFLHNINMLHICLPALSARDGP